MKHFTKLKTGSRNEIGLDAIKPVPKHTQTFAEMFDFIWAVTQATTPFIQFC